MNSSKIGIEDSLKSITKKFEKISLQPDVSLDIREFSTLLEELHQVSGDEKEKLREKDQILVNNIQIVANKIKAAGWIPQGEAVILINILGLLMLIESILWELKGEKGPIPTPQSPQLTNLSKKR